MFGYFLLFKIKNGLCIRFLCCVTNYHKHGSLKHPLAHSSVSEVSPGLLCSVLRAELRVSAMWGSYPEALGKNQHPNFQVASRMQFIVLVLLRCLLLLAVSLEPFSASRGCQPSSLPGSSTLKGTTAPRILFVF